MHLGLPERFERSDGYQQSAEQQVGVVLLAGSHMGGFVNVPKSDERPCILRSIGEGRLWVAVLVAICVGMPFQ